MKDLGPVSTMLGMEVRRNRPARRVFVHQLPYVEKILKRFGMLECKPCSTPMEVGDVSNSEDLPAESSVPFREAIGSLMYLMVGTRPDIAYVIGRLSQFSASPPVSHWKAVKRIFRYIKGSSTSGIFFGGEADGAIVGYSDSDWAGCTHTRKSTEGYVFKSAGGPVSCRSKKQTIVAMSSCEAEYVASISAYKEALWLGRIFANLHGRSSIDPIVIGVDNMGAIDTAKNASINQRNKHIEVHFHFVRDCVASGRIILKFWGLRGSGC